MKKKIEDFMSDNNLYALFEQQTYIVCVQEIKRIDNTSYWVFGKLYKIIEDEFYFEPQGCKSLATSTDAINEACNFFGEHSIFFDYN